MPLTSSACTDKDLAAEFKRGEDAYHDNDYQTALAIVYPLAAQGYAEAQYMIGYLKNYGLGGLTQDRNKAEFWLGLAANQEHKKQVTI